MNSTYYSKKFGVPETLVEDLMKEILIDASQRVTNLPPFDQSTLTIEVFNHIAGSPENMAAAFGNASSMFKMAAQELIMLPCNDPKNIVPLVQPQAPESPSSNGTLPNSDSTSSDPTNGS